MIAGFDIGGTKCAVLLGEEKVDDIEIFDRREFATEGTPQAVLDRMMTLLCDMLHETGHSEADVRAVGISCGGPLDGRRGIILSPPNLPGWDHVCVTDRVEKRLGFKA